VAPLALAVLLGTAGLVDAAVAPPAGSPPAGDGFTWLVPAADGGPVAFDPCRPVHWVLRTDGEPEGGRQAVLAAVAAVQAATGLRLVFDGTTDEAPQDDRPRRQPGRYGDRWAPVLVAWSTAAEHDVLGGRQVGSGVASWARVGGRRRLVSGQLVLDRDDLAPGGRIGPLAAATALHELAHVVGLGHVDDPEQVMHPVVSGRTEFAEGDLRGLRALGAQAPGPAPRTANTRTVRASDPSSARVVGTCPDHSSSSSARGR
jgi:hypothetical protein